ncbi:hypothetical protein [Bradyrhizobium sp. DOA1]|uniref:hypothetical protein n=1 Tax=Bradyrhizobium sp. DOA1 TaxID=1126616 RepID=UPI000AD95513|nr:hypothetical protein [Bradyrhizobium sp. DOA1]
MERIPSDYREAYPGPSAAALKKQLSRFFAETPSSCRIALALRSRHQWLTPTSKFIIDVFAGFLDSHQEMLDAIEASR